MNSIFFELTSILIVAGIIAFLVSLLRQPTIIAYILTGLIVGPLGYYKLSHGDAFSGLGQVGIALLLFMVGLELDITNLKKIGKAALFTGLAQMIFTSSVGYGILKLLHFKNSSALLIAVALTFSSTIIVVKLLSEKKDLQSLYGKLVIGIFLTQDFVAILILVALSTLNNANASYYIGLPAWQTIILTLIRGLILVLVTFWLSSKVFPHILKKIGRNDELLLVFALAWALGLAAFVSLPFMGFSLEIGGFLAGLSLAKTAAHYEISARIKSIRDFFIIIFFIILGSTLVLTNLAALSGLALLISLLVLVGNPIMVMILLGCFGYKPRTGFLAGATVSQISEFSLILVALGFKLGYISEREVGLVTLVAIITISLSSYTILYSAEIYNFLSPFLRPLDFRKGSAEKNFHNVTLANHIIVIGAHRSGHHIIDSLIKQKKQFIVVDFNPEIIEHYLEMNILAICGDITDVYIQDQVNLQNAKLVISTVSHYEDNMALLDAVKRLSINKKRRPKLIFMAQDEAEIKALYDQEIDYVVSPQFMGGVHLAKIIQEKNLNLSLKKLRENHLKMWG